MALAEDDDEVAGDNLGIAIHKHSFTRANDTADVRLVRQIHLFHFMPSDETILFDVELDDFGIGTGEIMHAAHRSIQQHLVDVGCRDGLLVEHGTDIQPFRHGDVVEVLHLGDGLAYAETLGCQAGEDVRFATVRHGYKSVRVLDAFFFEHTHIGAVGVDDQRVRHFVAQDVT